MIQIKDLRLGNWVRKYPSINAASKALGLKYWDIQRRLRNPLSHNEDGLNFTFINNN